MKTLSDLINVLQDDGCTYNLKYDTGAKYIKLGDYILFDYYDKICKVIKIEKSVNASFEYGYLYKFTGEQNRHIYKCNYQSKGQRIFLFDKS
jgi:hypothetical protein